MIKILIGEDHQLLKDGLRALLKDHEEIMIVGEASNGKEVIERLSETNPDIVLIDINMPVMSGLEATKYIQKNFNNIKVLTFSMHDNENYVADMFSAGAKGFILKNSGKDELIYAIKRVNSGSLYLSPEITVKVIHKILSDNNSVTVIPLPVPISKRETEVLNLLAEGLTNNEIAEKLFTSRRTVETHRKNLIEKTGSKNTASLIKFAIYNKLLK